MFAIAVLMLGASLMRVGFVDSGLTPWARVRTLYCSNGCRRRTELEWRPS